MFLKQKKAQAMKTSIIAKPMNYKEIAENLRQYLIHANTIIKIEEREDDVAVLPSDNRDTIYHIALMRVFEFADIYELLTLVQVEKGKPVIILH